MKQKLKDADEYDLLYAKDVYWYLKKAGVSAGIKRRMRRRERHEGVRCTRVFSEYGACGDTELYGDELLG